MTRSWILASLFSLAGGCAAIDGNFVGKTAPSSKAAPARSSGIAYEPMESLPPSPLKEDVPSLDASKEVWVPGYYQPVAGNWLWHQGRVEEKKDGYKLAPASYREEGGKVYFTPPRWRRADLAAQK
jgi:hypothetical protein